MFRSVTTIKLHKLTKKFDYLELAFPDLELKSGEILVLSGPNGSGKSTLINLMAGLLRPQQGSLLVGGLKLETLSQPELDRYRLQQVGHDRTERSVRQPARRLP